MSRTGTRASRCTSAIPPASGRSSCARVLGEGRLADEARIVVVGDLRVLERGMREAGVSFAVKRVPSVAAVDWSRRRSRSSISAISIRKRCRAQRYRRNQDG